jgi:hypothetical protein
MITSVVLKISLCPILPLPVPAGDPSPMAAPTLGTFRVEVVPAPGTDLRYRPERYVMEFLSPGHTIEGVPAPDAVLDWTSPYPFAGATDTISLGERFVSVNGTYLPWPESVDQWPPGGVWPGFSKAFDHRTTWWWADGDATLTFAPVTPEPGALAGLALAGMLLMRRRRNHV